MALPINLIGMHSSLERIIKSINTKKMVAIYGRVTAVTSIKNVRTITKNSAARKAVSFDTN